jgi:hypothetical protein
VSSNLTGTCPCDSEKCFFLPVSKSLNLGFILIGWGDCEFNPLIFVIFYFFKGFKNALFINSIYGFGYIICLLNFKDNVNRMAKSRGGR